MKRICITVSVIYLLAMVFLPATAAVPESIDVKVTECHDSVEISVTAYRIETQLTFLMQGLNIIIEQPDTLTLSFPSAPMVRSKVKRHPNEVKAVLESQRKRQGAGHDSINHVVRPDVLPLVAALNDTTATISYMVDGSMFNVQCSMFNINVDRENAVMEFSIKVPVTMLETTQRWLELCIYSKPANGNIQEFSGRRLSGENAPCPNGMGEGIRKEDAASRTFRISLTVRIKNSDEL